MPTPRSCSRRPACCSRARACTTPTNIVLMHHLNAGCVRTPCSRATWTTSCATARWSSSTSSPAAPWPGGAGPRACTRRWRPRKACRSRTRTRRSPRSPSRTTSASTTSSSGMTGTADTEAAEFQQIYGLEVVVIPTHMDMVRDDRADLVYLTKDEKFEAIIEDIRDCHARGQPVLVGTTSIETSEHLSTVLTKEKHRAPGAQRQAARARGADHPARRSPGRGHHRHQHGGPRYRHRARRQPAGGARRSWTMPTTAPAARP